MTFLLDTHVLLWASGDTKRLSPEIRDLLNDPANNVIFSAASIWEIVIKSALGREDFSVVPGDLHAGLIGNGYTELDIRSEHTLEVGRLPLIHRDPFDRILVAQARIEVATLLTADPTVARYDGPIRSI